MFERPSSQHLNQTIPLLIENEDHHMSQSTVTSREPDWSRIIGIGLGSILAIALIGQFQDKNLKATNGITTMSSYLATENATVTMVDPSATTIALAPPPAPAIVTNPTYDSFQPPSDQPRWLLSPCSAEEAVKIQADWSAHLDLPVEITNQLGQTFRLIPPGVYHRGTNEEAMFSLLETVPADESHWKACLASSSPAHEVVLTRPFYMATHETTQQDFQKLMGRNPSWYSTTGPEPHYVQQVNGMDTTRHPVEGVSWNDASDFCQKLNQTDSGKIAGEFSTSEKCKRLSPSYRLPTDAEWELAARAGNASWFWFGDKEAEVTGWFGGSIQGRTWPVRQGESNPLGLYEIHTSVWEWVADCWRVQEYQTYERLPVHDPLATGSAELPRIVRGGMWPDRRGRSFDRYAYESSFQTFFVGFRVCFEIVNREQ
jgi:formylglycine-generating enzyme required for sulfatase activity